RVPTTGGRSRRSTPLLRALMTYVPIWISGTVRPAVLTEGIGWHWRRPAGPQRQLLPPAEVNYYPRSNLLVCTSEGRTVQCRAVNPSAARFATTTLRSATTAVARDPNSQWRSYWGLYMRAERGRDVSGMWGFLLGGEERDKDDPPSRHHSVGGYG